MLEVPPVIRNSQCGFPEQADQQHKEKRKAQGPPIDEAPRDRVESYGREQRSGDEEREVAGKTGAVVGKCQVLLAKPRGPNQKRGQNQ